MRAMNKADADLIGRELELQRLVAAFEGDRSMAVAGEAGIGKTSLIRAAAGRAGRRVQEGGGFATLQHVPLLPIRRAIDAPLTGDHASVAAVVEQRIGPDMLFLDDLQWADRETLAVLRLLGRRICLAVAIRSGDPRTGDAVALADELGMERLDLGGVDPEAARSIVRRGRPGLSDAQAARIASRAGGNPLVLQEMASLGEPSMVLARSIRAGLDELSRAARWVVELVAIADRPVARRTLPEGVGEAVRTGFLVDRDGQVELRHALVAEAVRDGLPADLRAGLHSRLADLTLEPSEAARHLALAGDATRAASVATTALTTEQDPTTRANLLALIAETAGPEGGVAARLLAGAALSAVSDWQGVVRLLSDGPEGGPEEMAERDALLVHAAFSLGDHAFARAILERSDERALPAGSPAAGHLAIERAAFMVNVDGALPAAIGLLESELAEHAPDRPSHHAIRVILESIRMLTLEPIDIDYLRAAVDSAIDARAFATAADLARVVTFALHIWHGPEAAIAFVESVGRRFDEAGAAGLALEAMAELVQANVLAGRPVDAVARADDVLERPAPIRARQTASLYRARALGMMGLLDEAEQSLRDLEPTVSSDFVGRGILLATQADLAFWGGLTERSIALVDAVLTIPSPILGAYGLPEITRAWAQFDAGLVPAEARGIVAAPTQAGAPFELEGLRLLHAGEAIGAAAQFAEAAQRWAAFNVPRALFCRWAEGEALRQAGEVEAAIDRLEAALEDANHRRLEVVAVRIRRSLRRAGRRVSTVDRGSEGGGLRLTRRERELVALVGQGLTNTEIARRMGLGRPTVARILSNAMGKVGATSRAQAVSLVDDLV